MSSTTRYTAADVRGHELLAPPALVTEKDIAATLLDATDAKWVEVGTVAPGQVNVVVSGNDSDLQMAAEILFDRRWGSVRIHVRRA